MGSRPSQVAAAGGNSKVFGEALFNNMLLPFEVASVILLVAMVGAIILVKKEKAPSWPPGRGSRATEPTADVAEEEV